MSDLNVAGGAGAAASALPDWRLRLRTAWLPKDYDQLWRTLFGEARGEPIQGQIAVAWVILNRAALGLSYAGHHGKPHPLYGDGTIALACDEPEQFSCWNDGSASRTRCLAALAGAPETVRVMQVAACVLLGDAAPPFDGDVTHYHVVTDPFPPGWIPKPRPDDWVQPMPVKVIGAHAFYRAP